VARVDVAAGEAVLVAVDQDGAVIEDSCVLGACRYGEASSNEDCDEDRVDAGSSHFDHSNRLMRL
jgi:hypothetical protein